MNRPLRRICISPSPNLYRHLATELHGIEHLPETEQWLVLWQSPPSVVIGRNQNPWRECNLPLLKHHRMLLGRRISGGGAVYQDEGNLNYSFVMPKSHYNRDLISKTVLCALRRLNIDATTGPRHILEAKGKKISGTAFRLGRRTVLHHGTLLINSDLNRLRDCLRPTLSGLAGAGIHSVPSPVINLTDLQPGISVRDVIAAMSAEFNPDEELRIPPIRELCPVVRSLQSSEWLFDHTPRFTLSGQSGAMRYVLTVQRGIVEKVEGKPEKWRGCRFDALLPNLLLATERTSAGE